MRSVPYGPLLLAILLFMGYAGTAASARHPGPCPGRQPEYDAEAALNTQRARLFQHTQSHSTGREPSGDGTYSMYRVSSAESREPRVPLPIEPVDPAPPADPEETFLEQVERALESGDFEAAITLLRSSGREELGEPDYQLLLANLYLTTGAVGDADELLLTVLDSDDEHQAALFFLAMIRGRQGETRAQRDFLERLVEINPRHWEAQAALGRLQMQNRRYGPAEAAFRASLEVEPDNVDALAGMGSLKVRTDDAATAEAYLDRALEVAPDLPLLYADRSHARALQYKFAEAEEDLQRAIALDGDYLWYYYDRGKIRLERNDAQGAVEDFNEVIERDGSIFLTYVYRARALDQLEEQDRAIADYRAALELRPDYQPGMTPLAVLLFEDERFPEAAELFQRAYERRNPNDPPDHGLILLSALSRKLAGEDREARRYLERMARDLAGSGLFADMARYYNAPGSDAYIRREVSREENRLLRARMNFYLAGQYEVLNQTRSAQALYREIVDEDLRGFVETRLARERYERLKGSP